MTSHSNKQTHKMQSEMAEFAPTADIWQSLPNITLSDVRLVPPPGEHNETMSCTSLAHWPQYVKT